jgi:hypothetical protein
MWDQYDREDDDFDTIFNRQKNCQRSHISRCWSEKNPFVRGGLRIIRPFFS